MEIISAVKDTHCWWVVRSDDLVHRVRHSIEAATDRPISDEEDFMCALLDKLYPEATTRGR